MHKVLATILLAVGLLFFTGSGWADMGKGAMPLKTAEGSKAEGHNQKGMEHFAQGHWDIAKTHFMEAAKADPQSAEVHYNVALALDKSGDHAGATEHFKKAYELGKANTEIQHSEILKKHLKI
ncbi:MAG: tetratricopeptide repeat protein [Nitrospiraceae bacterium]